MAGAEELLGGQYRDLYSGYYREADLRKREISAVQTADYLVGALDGIRIDKVIDVGSGEGSLLVQMDRREIAQELHAVEISDSGVIAIRKRNIPRLQAVEVFDGYNIPYPDRSFDLATSTHVLEHVEHERLFLREIRRVTRLAYIEVPLEHGLKVQRAIVVGRKYGHINFYVKSTFLALLESVGFTVLQSGIFSPSTEYEICIAGPTRGRLKNMARRLALRAAPNLAPWVLGYNGYALCRSY